MRAAAVSAAARRIVVRIIYKETKDFKRDDWDRSYVRVSALVCAKDESYIPPIVCIACGAADTENELREYTMLKEYTPEPEVIRQAIKMFDEAWESERAEPAR